jgi:hypothetical protein
MVYEVVKQLTSSDAARLRKLQQKEKFFTSIKALPLLPIKNKEIYTGKLIPSTKVGPIILQKHQFSRYGNDLFFDEVRAPLNKGFTKFGISVENYSEYAIMLDLNYTFDSFELFFEKSLNNMGVITTIAGSFYNRRPLYQEIFTKALLPYENELTENAGATFAKNLLSLFSITKPAKKVAGYHIPEASLSNQLVKPGKAKEKTLLQLGYSGLLCRSLKEGQCHIHLKTYLAPDNTLVIVSDLLDSEIYTAADFYPHLGRPWNSPNIELKNNKKLNAMIDNQLNDYFSNWEALLNFGLELYKMVRTNFLLENI